MAAKNAASPAAKLPESGTVTVACKMPNGYKMRVFNMVDFDEPVMGGGVKTRKRAELDTKYGVVVLNGFAHEKGKAPSSELIGGFGLTSGVDAQFFARWLEQNKDSAIVRNGLIFAAKSTEDVKAQAREQKKLQSGLQPLSMARTMKNGRSVPVDARVPVQVEKANVADEEAA
jgi:hypothetical protein